MSLVPEGLNLKLKIRSYETEVIKEIEVRSYNTVAKLKTEIEKQF